MRLSRRFFARSSLDVAPDLLGRVLVVRRAGETVAVRLTEVEAYDGEADPGSHAFRGPTPRNQVMYGEAGHLYVYFSYGMHWCANIVCGRPGTATAVLLRAGEVVDGLDVARRRRPSSASARDLARGPARLASAAGLVGADSGLDLCDGADAGSDLESGQHVESGPRRGPGRLVLTGPRVGVSGRGGDAAAYPWRFWLDGEPTVSPYRPHVPKRRQRSTGDA